MPAHIGKPVLGCLACVFGLFLVTLFAFKVGAAETLDARGLARLVAEPGSAADNVATLFAHLADPAPLLVMLVGVCALAARWGRWPQALAAVAIVAGANLTTQFLKALFSHERFHAFLGEGQPWVSSFPSGHTTAAASISVALLIAVPARLRAPAALLGAAFTGAVGIAVIVLEWHYPSDVLGGLLIAAGWGFAAVAALRLLGPRGAPSHRGDARGGLRPPAASPSR
jgi:membrane-associated phospholipid phosphatase